jgi:hypothetical protein
MTMNLREAILEAAKQRKGLEKRQKKVVAQLVATPLKGHPRFWAALEHIVIRRYERRTGKKFPGDWKDLIDWLVANLPAILQIMILILAL